MGGDDTGWGKVAHFSQTSSSSRIGNIRQSKQILKTKRLQSKRTQTRGHRKTQKHRDSRLPGSTRTQSPARKGGAAKAQSYLVVR